MARFQITTIKPYGYSHSECFREVGETLYYGLKALGYDVEMRDNLFSQTRWNIVLGAHLLSRYFVAPPRTIIYNLEQYDSAAFKVAQEIYGFDYWWDYSERNILRCRPNIPARVVPIGYVPELTRIKPREQDIDVLFYGSMNSRRKRIIDECAAAGLKVHAAFNVYGRERDELISRAKVVLNVHFYESKIFEIVRCSYLMANRKCVATEDSAGMEDGLGAGACEVAYSEIVEACEKLVGDGTARSRWEESAFHAISKRDEKRILEAALDGADWETEEPAVQSL